MEGNGGKKEAERERAELQQGALGLLAVPKDALEISALPLGICRITYLFVV